MYWCNCFSPTFQTFPSFKINCTLCSYNYTALFLSTHSSFWYSLCTSYWSSHLLFYKQLIWKLERIFTVTQPWAWPWLWSWPWPWHLVTVCAATLSQSQTAHGYAVTQVRVSVTTCDRDRDRDRESLWPFVLLPFHSLELLICVRSDLSMTLWLLQDAWKYRS